MRFIGSKTRLLSSIKEVWSQHIGAGRFRVADLFCGTAAVSCLFKDAGNIVTANDSLYLAYVFGLAALGINCEPRFDRLFKSRYLGSAKGPGTATRYDCILTFLNNIAPEEGFVFREYSPGGTRDKLHQRYYFTDENARKIDAIRRRIGLWRSKKLLSEQEFCLLLADLMHAANRVANTAGTYGCFNREWDPRAFKHLCLKRSSIIMSESLAHSVFHNDANVIARQFDFDVLYLDPPYTWRQYAAYYHVLETIARADEPLVEGITGLRPWHDSRSRYCDKRDAPNALLDLISHACAKHLILSYAEHGLIRHDQILAILETRGTPVWSEILCQPYRSAKNRKHLWRSTERLYYVRLKK